MQPKSFTPEQQRVATFVRTADRDMETAQSLVVHSPHLYENIGFHCQQAVEKYAKAVAVASELPAPYIHVLVQLLDPLEQAGVLTLLPAEAVAAAVLQDFAVQWRYELDDAPSYTSQDLLDMARGFQAKLRPLAVQFLV